MSFSPHVFGSNTQVSGTSVVISGSAVAGRSIGVLFYHAGSGTLSIVDSSGTNLYTAANTATSAANGAVVGGFYSLAIGTGITSITISSTAADFISAIAWDNSATGTIAYSDSVGNGTYFLNNPGTTDGTTSGTLSIGSASSGLVMGLCTNTNGGGTIATGTGFTGTTFGPVSNFFGEYKAVSANAAATFTDTANQSPVVMGLMFVEASGGGAAPFIPTPDVEALPKSQIGSVALSANLLLTTLAMVASLLPLGSGQISQSAPRSTAFVQVDSRPSLLTLGIKPAPGVRQQYESAPYAKSVVSLDPVNRLPLFPAVIVNSQPTIEFISAPKPLSRQAAEQQYNRLPLLPVVVQQIPPGLQGPFVSTPAWPYDQLGFMAGSVIGPPGQITITASQPTIGFIGAPSVAPRLAAEQQPNTLLMLAAPAAIPLPLGYPPPPLFVQNKYQPQVDAYPNVLVLGIKPPPAVVQLSTSAPITKLAVVAHNAGSQLTIGFIQPSPPIPLPLGLPVDMSQFQAKFTVQVDPQPNILILGIPLPPPVVVNPNDHDGFPKRHRRKKFDDTAQTQVVRESRAKPKKAKAETSEVSNAIAKVSLDSKDEEEALINLIAREDQQLVDAIDEAAQLLGKLH